MLPVSKEHLLVTVTDEVMAERRRMANEDLKSWLDGVTERH
jgi:hypothetical protein